MTPYTCVHVPIKTASALVKNPVPTAVGGFLIGGLYFAYGMLPFLLVTGGAALAGLGYSVKSLAQVRKPVKPFDPVFDMPDNFMIHHGSPEACVAGCGMPGAHKSVVNLNGIRHALHACDAHTAYMQDYFANHAQIPRAS